MNNTFPAPAGRPGPFWDEYNPWNDRLVYVPVEELAACVIDANTQYGNSWGMVEAIANWVQYGDRLDAYILTSGVLVSAGVRYGPEGRHYLTPAFSLPKLIELRARYMTHKIPVPREGAKPGA